MVIPGPEESHESFTLPQCTFTRRHGRRELFCSYIAHRGRTSAFNGGKESLPSEIIELELESFQPAAGFCFYKAPENVDRVATKGLPGSCMSANRKLKTIPLRSNSFMKSLRSPWFCSPQFFHLIRLFNYAFFRTECVHRQVKNHRLVV